MSPQYYQSSLPLPEVKDESLDEFVGQRSRILKSKLDVLMQEIWIRLGIKGNNFQKLETDLSKVHCEMSELSKRAYFHGDTTGKEDLQQLRQTELELEKEKREQDVSCWNDVVKVMHEVLNTWEAHQQSTARAKLLSNKGIDNLLRKLEVNADD